MINFIDSFKDLFTRLRPRLMAYYQDTDLTIQTKSDNSPVTAADAYCHDKITAFLQQHYSDIDIVSEENDNLIQPEASPEVYWCLDPLDGTKEFINHTGEFTINLALVENHQAVFGMVYIPVDDTLYFGQLNHGAFKLSTDGQKEAIAVAKEIPNELRIIASRRHGNDVIEAYLKKFPDYEIIHKGSAWKLCLIADGIADVYPRFAPTSAWDTAAGQCIVEAAGGVVVDLQGEPLRYGNKETWLNPKFICCQPKMVPILEELNILHKAS